MRPERKAVIILASGVAIGAWQAATAMAEAEASDYGFYTSVLGSGIQTSEDVAIANGKLTCVWLNNGVSQQEVVRRMAAGAHIPEYKSMVFTGMAVAEYCPQYLAAPGPRRHKGATKAPRHNEFTDPDYYGDEPWGPGS